MFSISFDNRDGNEILIEGETLESLAADYSASDPSRESSKVEDSHGFTVGFVHSDGTWCSA